MTTRMTHTAPSPDGQVSEMAAHKGLEREKGARVRAISSTSQRAITPRLGGKPGRAGAVPSEVPPSGGAIGPHQVDEMTLRRAASWAHSGSGPHLSAPLSAALQVRDQLRLSQRCD